MLWFRARLSSWNKYIIILYYKFSYLSTFVHYIHYVMINKWLLYYHQWWSNWFNIMTTPLVFSSEAGSANCYHMDSLTDPPNFSCEASSAICFNRDSLTNPPIFGCEASSAICYHMDLLTHWPNIFGCEASSTICYHMDSLTPRGQHVFFLKFLN